MLGISFLAALFMHNVASARAAGGVTALDRAVPAYSHVVVIMEENKDYARILDGVDAPYLAGLAHRYGSATRFYGEVHPSEANYVALLGGETFGIHDDDAFFCAPRQASPVCSHSTEPGYVSHTVEAPHLGTQLEARGLTWRGYYENLPHPGSEAVAAGDLSASPGPLATMLYASKHSGFLNFASVQRNPSRAEHLVGFDRLDADLTAGTLPNFALIVPNQCNEMHGLRGPGVPADCEAGNVGPLIRRGDRELESIIGRMMTTAAWRSSQNVAIVVTFDEGSGKTREGCCSVTPDAVSNYGGGHIPTIVVTNHGPRGLAVATPYNHYSLLRTIEDAFGLHEYLGRAAETQDGVVPLTSLLGGRSE